MWFLNKNGSFPLLPVIRINITSERERPDRGGSRAAFWWGRNLSGPHPPRPLSFLSRYSGVKRDEVMTSQHLYHLCRHKRPRERKSPIQLAIPCEIFYPGNTWTLTWKNHAASLVKEATVACLIPFPLARDNHLSVTLFLVFLIVTFLFLHNILAPLICDWLF